MQSLNIILGNGLVTLHNRFYKICASHESIYVGEIHIFTLLLQTVYIVCAYPKRVIKKYLKNLSNDVVQATVKSVSFPSFNLFSTYENSQVFIMQGEHMIFRWFQTQHTCV